MDVSLHGKVALVTGASRGIGQAIAATMAASGAKVMITSRKQDQLDAAAATMTGEVAAIASHVGDPASGDALVAATVERFGGLDILVNNAATNPYYGPTLGVDESRWDKTFEVNLRGPVFWSAAAHRAVFAERPGVIINIASVGGGVAAFPGFRLSDGMSKAAVAHLSRQLAAEQVAPGVDVFALCPGATNTAMFQQSTLNSMTPDEKAAFIASLPKGRLIEPDEIAEIIAFLCGPHSGVLHGAVIDASMGLGVRPGLMSERAH
jgi:NAD(P)-dependent dehydrogenase (short-subunit alcohol dehydrogenase family)